MAITNLLIQNITELYTSYGIMKGGKLNAPSTVVKPNKVIILFISFLIILFVLLIKALIVFTVYNYLTPKLIYSLGMQDKTLEKIENDFRPLTYAESLLLVILFNIYLNI